MRQNLALFSELVALILNSNCEKPVILTRIIKNIKIEGEWGGLEAKNCFQRQSWKKYIRQTLVLM